MDNDFLIKLESLAEIDDKILCQYEKLIILEIEAKKEHKDLGSEYKDAIDVQKDNIKQEKLIFKYFTDNNDYFDKAIQFLQSNVKPKRNIIAETLVKNNHDEFIRARMLRLFNDFETLSYGLNLDDENAIPDYKFIKKLIIEGKNIAAEMDLFFIESKYHFTYINPCIESKMLDNGFSEINDSLISPKKQSEQSTKSKSGNENNDIFHLLLDEIKCLFDSTKNDKESKRLKLLTLYINQANISSMFNKDETEDFKQYVDDYLTKKQIPNKDELIKQLFDIGDEFYPSKNNEDIKKDTIS